jgi:glycosyltransferase involved in cell wall biosynthesis
MRIALDSTPLVEPAGGIPRYVTELALALAELDSGDEIHLLSDQTTLHFDPRLLERPNIVATPPAGPRFGGKWWSLALPVELRRRGIDVFHGTNFEAPYWGGVPALVTVHDLSPWMAPPIRPEGSERVRRRAPWLLRRVERVLTPSEAVRYEAIARFGLDPDRVEAIPLGVAPAPPADEAAGWRPPAGPFVCYLGAANPRKNLPVLIDSWRLAREQAPPLRLVLAGPGTEKFDSPAEGISGLGVVNEAKRSALLSAAVAFAYPSLYEGFGLPVVEAMRAGAPVIVSRTAALLETAGDAALVVDPDSREQWARAILRVLREPGLGGELKRRGAVRASDFCWRQTAERTRAAYERAIRRI